MVTWPSWLRRKNHMVTWASQPCRKSIIWWHSRTGPAPECSRKTMGHCVSPLRRICEKSRSLRVRRVEIGWKSEKTQSNEFFGPSCGLQLVKLTVFLHASGPPGGLKPCNLRGMRIPGGLKPCNLRRNACHCRHSQSVRTSFFKTLAQYVSWETLLLTLCSTSRGVCYVCKRCV